MQTTKAQHSPTLAFFLRAPVLKLTGISRKGISYFFHSCINHFLRLLEYR